MARAAATSASRRRRVTNNVTSRGLFAPFAFAYALGLALVWLFIWAGNPWEILSGTRILVPLMRLGVVALTDADSGFIAGIPDHTYTLAANDPVDWLGVVFAIILLVVVVALRGGRLRRLAIIAGAPGTRRGVAGASAYGHSIGAFYPYGYGQAATIAGLEEDGIPTETATQIVFLDRLVAGIDLLVIAALGFIFVGWTTTLGVAVVGFVMMAAAWFLTRRQRPDGDGPLRWAREALAAASRDAGSLVAAIVISVAAFLLEVAAIFMIVQAFSSLLVIIDLDYRWLMLAIAGGHAASYIRVTPGGLGQFEWGMALSLNVVTGGLNSVVVVLTMITRYLVSLITLIGLRFRGPQSTPQRTLDLLSEGDR